MQLITIRNDKIKPCPGPAECASTATVDVNLTSSRQFEGLTLDQVRSQYEDVFDGLGNLGTPLRLEVDETVKPVQQPLRRVPEALRTPLKEYLDDLESRGVIEKVERPTEWVNSVVITRKANGNLRLCLDPKPLNKALKRCHFPMPVIEDVLPELGKAKIFTKVDCKDGYWQIKLTKESSLLTTFATPFDRYKWNRMPFGISPASEIFQLRLHEAVEGLDGVYAIADDILVAGAGDTMKDAVADHDFKIKKLLGRCQERNIKLNKQKVAFKQTEVPYIGHLLTSEGVKADPSKIEAVTKMERPTDVTGVQRIMGTVGYLAKFLPRLSEVSQPLRQLTKKGTEFLWDEIHDRAFSRIKEMVTDIRDELVIQDGLLFRGDRLVVPKALRKRMLQALHSSHQGIESTLRRARETIYWPNMKSDIKDFTSKCETCASYSTRQQKETLVSHDVPDRPWAKISTDLFDLDHKSYMVTVDYFSGFFEIDRLYDLKVSTVIRKLKTHMARYGIPDEVVSDSGSQFTSREFKNFAKEYGFNHVTTSPYHHQSNGRAESAVKEAKKILKKTTASKSDPYLALLAHRNTPQEGFGTSPAQRLFSRRTKTNLPTSSNLLKPSVAEDTLEKDKLRKLKQKFYYDGSANDLPNLQKNDVVRMQPFRLNEKTWRKAKVLKPLGRRSYVVESNGQLYIRNRRHLKRSAEAESVPTEEWPTPSNHHHSKVSDHLANEQPKLKPVATTKVNQSTTPSTESNKDHPISTTPLNQDQAKDRVKDQPLRQQVSPTGCESQVRTRSGRLVKPPSRYTDFVTL